MIVLVLIFPLCKGRQGAPKKRLLRCDHTVKRLYWDKPPSETTTAGNTSSIRFLSSKRSVNNQPAGGMDDSSGLVPDLPTEEKSILLSSVTSIRRGNEDDPDEVDGYADASGLCSTLICRWVKEEQLFLGEI
jgi:hypothetical protein